MRRNIKNQISIFLVIIVAIFTLLSYVFDQLVIRQEDSLRNANVKYQNLNTNISNLNSISNQLTYALDYTDTRIMQFKRNKNYWLKNILLISNYNTYSDLSFNLKDKEIINTFNDKPEYIERLIKSRFADETYDVISTINNIEDKLYNIYSWNLKFFPQYSKIIDGEEHYAFPEINYQDVLDQNKNLFYSLNLSMIVAFADEITKENALKDYNLKNWADIHKYSYILINRLFETRNIIHEDSIKIDEIIVEKELLRENLILIVKKITAKKNYFILLSIICQIASLLFLLVLFRSLIKNKL